MKRILDGINKVQIFFGGLFLVLMVSLTCANILFREFGLPVRGTYELMGFFGAVIFAFSLAFSHDKKEHLYVNIIYDRLPVSLKRIFSIINKTVCLVFFSILAYQLVKKAFVLKDVGELSETLRLPYYPFILVTAFGVLVLSVLLLYEVVLKIGGRD